LGSLLEDSISDATDDNLASVEIDAGDGDGEKTVLS